LKKFDQDIKNDTHGGIICWIILVEQPVRVFISLRLYQNNKLLQKNAFY